MNYFPQLTSGAMCQFPALRAVRRRTVVNESADGRMVKMADPGASELVWRLVMKGLSDIEWTAIETLFRATEGRLGTFTFLDPLDNLLLWSEDLIRAVWAKSAGVSVSRGIGDPLAGFAGARVTNGGAAAGGVSQSIAGSESYWYCLSGWAKSDTATEITLFQGTTSEAFPLRPEWKRLQLSGTPGESTAFGLTIRAGESVDVFGLQVEAQPGASRYKRTTSAGGVHPAASFLDDVLERTGDGVNNNSCTLGIRARA